MDQGFQWFLLLFRKVFPGKETVNDRLSYEIHRTLAPRIYEGGAPVRTLGRGE